MEQPVRIISNICSTLALEAAFQASDPVAIAGL
jgi:hypothetical protein